MRLVGRGTGAMPLMQGAVVREAVTRIMTGLSRCLRRERPGRSYGRVAGKPGSGWMMRRPA